MQQSENAIISGQTFDEERALYHLCDSRVENCRFEGAADGESALKEARNIQVYACSFLLRYPLWHVRGFSLSRSAMALTARAPLWYSRDGEISDCTVEGVKCLRECDGIRLRDCRIVSPEFGWRCRNLLFDGCTLESEYALFESSGVSVSRMRMKGKYSFQYVRNMEIADSTLDTKDAFWHSENVTVRDSEILGEYLGWYSRNLTLIHCRIRGTQPFCYCENLKLIDCEMEQTDLAFEYSTVDADIHSTVLSVKNPKAGRIVADGYGEILLSDSVIPCHCEIVTREK